MSAYTITTGDQAQRKVIEEALTGLDLLPADLREKIITAWTTTWLGSPFQSLSELPYAPIAPNFPLFDHVNDVIRIGITLARQASQDWGETYDFNTLVTILILHDVDKPLVFARHPDGTVTQSAVGKQLPHGVVGALLLNELGFSHDVVSVVATHATDAPFHGESFYSYVLHYADMFASERVMRQTGQKPFYDRKK